MLLVGVVLYLTDTYENGMNFLSNSLPESKKKKKISIFPKMLNHLFLKEMDGVWAVLRS